MFIRTHLFNLENCRVDLVGHRIKKNDGLYKRLQTVQNVLIQCMYRSLKQICGNIFTKLNNYYTYLRILLYKWLKQKYKVQVRAWARGTYVDGAGII